MTAGNEEKNGNTSAPEHADSRASSHMAESLYETYLAARLTRARRRLRRAKAALLRDPRNLEKLATLRRAEDEMEKLQAQRFEQAREAAAPAREPSSPRPAEETIPDLSTGATMDFRTAQAARADQTCAPQAGSSTVAEPFFTEEQPAAPRDKAPK